MENEANLIKRVVAELERFGIKKSNKGYVYLRQAIILAYNDFSAMRFVTKLIYPTIAETHQAAPANVERGIRHAIESSRAIFEAFGGKPTNSEFIAEIADRLRVEDGLI